MSALVFLRRVRYVPTSRTFQVVPNDPPVGSGVLFDTLGRTAALAGQYEPPSGLSADVLLHVWDALATYAISVYGPNSELFGYEALADGTFNILVFKDAQTFEVEARRSTPSFS